MAFELYSRVHETTTTTGTGALTLAGAVSGKQAFSAAYDNGDTMFCVVTMGTDWETFLGTFASGANTITRTTMFQSSNADAAVNWSAGTKDIFVSMLGPSELNTANKYSYRTAIGAAAIFTGAYTGDGATSLAITGIGFTPKYVKIWQRQTGDEGQVNSYETTAEILDDHASGASIINYRDPDQLQGMLSNSIIALGTDGFTVDDNGADRGPNTSAAVYNYIAIG